MRPLSSAAVATWSAIASLGCAALSGLDEVHESDCAPLCDDGGGDSTDVVAAESGAPAEPEAAPPDAPESDPREAAGDAVDAPPQDAPSDSGCGPSSPGDACEGTCPVAHFDNGLGESYFACSEDPEAVALAACAAFTGDRTRCDGGFLCGPDDAGPIDELVCSDGSTADCICWDYSGPTAGHLYDSNVAGNCACPTLSDPAYN